MRTASCEKRKNFFYARLVPDGSARRKGKGRWSETGSVCGHKLVRPVSSGSVNTADFQKKINN